MRITKLGKFLHCLIIVTILFIVSGCSSFRLPSIPKIEPWVAPYEREYLADPIMSFNKDPLSNKYRQHVFNTREGARGAGYAHGSGCGCN